MRLDSSLSGTPPNFPPGGGGAGGITSLNLFRTAISASGNWDTSEAGRSFVRTSALDDLNRPAHISSVVIQIAAAPSSAYDLTEMCMAELDPSDPTKYLGNPIPVTFQGNSAVHIDAGGIVTADSVLWDIDLTTFNGFWFGFIGSGYTTREDSRAGTGGAHQSVETACANVSMSELSRTYLIHQITGGLL